MSDLRPKTGVVCEIRNPDDKEENNILEQHEQYALRSLPRLSNWEKTVCIFRVGSCCLCRCVAKGCRECQSDPGRSLSAQDFSINTPLIYSIALRRESPDVLRGSLRARRTLFEGLMLAMAEKTVETLMAEQAADHAMDAAESAVTLGKPAFRAALLAALYAGQGREVEAETARRTLEASLQARGFVPQRLYYIPERALLHLQPGGKLFPGLDEPVLLLDEALSLLPIPARRVLPSLRCGLDWHAR